MVTGTPASGPGSSPRAILPSIREACASTSSGRWSTTALIDGLTASNRASADEAASFAETFFERIRPASSAADRRQRSSMANSLSSPEVVAPPGRQRHTAGSKRFRAKACPALDAGWIPVRVKKTRQNKGCKGAPSLNLEMFRKQVVKEIGRA